MKCEEHLVRMTIDEAAEYGFDVYMRENNKRYYQFVISYEGLQDSILNIKNLCSIRTPEITDEEIADWKKADSRLEAVNMEDARKRVTFIDKRFVPYEEYNW